MKKYLLLLFLLCIVIIPACRKPEAYNDEQNEVLAGGSQTVFDAGAGAFSHAFPDLSEDKEQLHDIGDLAFEATFVTAPAPIHPGLGPVYNSVSCASCHIADGRGKPPVANEPLLSMLFRISIPGTDLYGGPNPVPGFGGQLQQKSIVNKSPEADVNISYTEVVRQFDDHASYQMRYPSYTIKNSYIAVPSGMMMSPRVAPPVFGLGLLEAIADETILANADEGDINDDGISGKPNYVWDVLNNKMSLGRFGWKCGQPSLLQQSAGAYNEDMGITNFIFKQESSSGQPQYDDLDDESEVSDSLLYAVAFYVKSLAVPARRNTEDAIVIKGKQLFIQSKCASCHIPMMKTAVNVTFPEISNQTIFPYTDLLLHDMGNDLADNRPDYSANGNEWRTPPLWGIGLTKNVNGHNNFLHDGRARTLMEAIMWHGGEAEQSRDAVKQMNAADRNALIRFLESL
jgi:CxxC motif-containing protein (DUF1111 family)